MPNEPNALSKATAIKATDRLLLQNQAWAQQERARDPGFFDRLLETQTPTHLWIGCSDSRVAAETVTGAKPGQIFVQRNIANLVVPTDMNLASVLQYAVDVLKVEHVIVCGHHGCGGVKAAMGDDDFGMLNGWLRNIKDIYERSTDELSHIGDKRQREDRMCELNAIAQVHNLMRTSTIQKAWAERRAPWLHAWVYGLSDGILQELLSVAPGTPIDAPYRFSFSK